jgi:hypothetical protein
MVPVEGALLIAATAVGINAIVGVTVLSATIPAKLRAVAVLRDDIGFLLPRRQFREVPAEANTIKENRLTALILVNDRTCLRRDGQQGKVIVVLGRDVMIKLSNYDGRFVVRLLELRRAAILEMTQRSPEQSCKERAAELNRLDAVLTQIKAELPRITDPETTEAVKLVRSL